jgi:cytosine/adenosine deaminase-related metal-dependent hydrolase
MPASLIRNRAMMARATRRHGYHAGAGDILLPGFVNAHHHVGLAPLQHGAPDMPLELW